MTDSATPVFATVAPVYRSLGWLGTLPLPPNAKFSPPDGWTGRHDRDPDDATVTAWASNGYALGNIAIRMPDDIIGLDVDAYDAWRPAADPETGAVVMRLVHKRGAETLAELESTLGPLPATWRSSARPAPSGIRLFRVPAGTITESNLPGDIEVIRRGHRYMVAPPSLNPETGTAYGWSFGAGLVWEPRDRPPRWERSAGEVPELPGAWAVRLSSRPATATEPLDDFWQTTKSALSAARQWDRLRDRTIGLVRRCEMFGWGGDAHGQLLEITRELAQLAPADAHRAVGEWFAAGGAGWVDPRVWAMLESALGKYPADRIVAPAVVLPVSTGATVLPPAYVAAGAASVPSPGQLLQTGMTGVGSGSPLTPGVRQAAATPDGSTAANPSSIGQSATNHTSSMSEDDVARAAPRRLPMIPDGVWEAYGWCRSIRAQARVADVCPDAVLGASLATYAARIPPGVRIVTGTKMPLGTNLVVSLVGPSGSDKSTAFTLAQKIMPGSAVPVINNPNSGEAFAASFVHPDPEAEGAVSKRAKVLKPDPRALFYVAEGAMLGSVGARLGSTWLPHLRSLAVDESLSTTNATSEINRQVPAQSYSAGVVIGFQVTTATTVLHDTHTGTAQRFLWFTSLSSEDPSAADLAHAAVVPAVPMAVPVLTRLGAGIDDENNVIQYLTVTQSITDRIRYEQRQFRLTRDITATDDHDAHRHTLLAKLAAIAVLADDRVMIDERDWLWAEALYAASAATRDELIAISEDTERDERTAAAQRMGEADRVRRQYDSAEVRVAEVLLRKLDRSGSATRRELTRAAGRDYRLVPAALDQLETAGWVVRGNDGQYRRIAR